MPHLPVSIEVSTPQSLPNTEVETLKKKLAIVSAARVNDAQRQLKEANDLHEEYKDALQNSTKHIRTTFKSKEIHYLEQLEANKEKISSLEENNNELNDRYEALQLKCDELVRLIHEVMVELPEEQQQMLKVRLAATVPKLPNKGGIESSKNVTLDYPMQQAQRVDLLKLIPNLLLRDLC